MAVTARDVAIRAGVSVSTVSRALTHPDLVSEETRVRIETVAQELNYHPNSMARSLSTGRTHHVGLVVPDLENPFFSAIAKRVQAYARQLGYSVFIADTDENMTLEAELVHQLAPQVDGVLLCSPRCDPDQVLALAEATPLVLLNRPVESLSSVSFDNADGVHQAIRHLWALGHRIIGYAGGPRASWSDKVRRECFFTTVEELGMKGVNLGFFQPVHHGGMAAGDLALASGATAVLAYNDLIAIGLVQRLIMREIHVPADISVVGIDGIAQASFFSPAITTVAGSLHQLASTAVDELVNPGTEPTERLLPVDLIVRASTAEAPPESGQSRPRAGNPLVLSTSGPDR